jgi:hypothetical protein
VNPFILERHDTNEAEIRELRDEELAMVGGGEPCPTIVSGGKIESDCCPDPVIG